MCLESKKKKKKEKEKNKERTLIGVIIVKKKWLNSVLEYIRILYIPISK